MDRPRVLIVDDEELVRTMLGDILLEEGYEVATASSATGAMARLLSEQFDAVILDLGLGEFSGSRLFCLMARHLNGPLPEVILFSGLEEGELRMRAEELGVRYWFRKGCPQKRFLRAVSTAAAGRERGTFSSHSMALPTPIGLRIPEPLEA